MNYLDLWFVKSLPWLCSRNRIYWLKSKYLFIAILSAKMSRVNKALRWWDLRGDRILAYQTCLCMVFDLKKPLTFTNRIDIPTLLMYRGCICSHAGNELNKRKLLSSGRVLGTRSEGRGFDPRPIQCKMEVVSKPCQVIDCWCLVIFLDALNDWKTIVCWEVKKEWWEL